MHESAQDSTASEMSTSDFMRTFLERHHPPRESIAYLESTWLSSYLSSPKYKPIATFSRHLKSSGEDYYFSRTINTPATIPHMVSLQLHDFKTPEPTEGEVSRGDGKSIAVAPAHPDVLVLISLGRTGLDGHPSTIHGGVTCAILDETMGLLVMLHDNNIRGPGPRDSLYTANLNVSYRTPVPTPGEVLVKLWLVARKGRKWYSKGQIVDKQGVVLAEGDGLWITMKRSKI